jgi:hypothetical protein
LLVAVSQEPRRQRGDTLRHGLVAQASDLSERSLDERMARNAARGVTYLGRARCWNADPNLKGTSPERRGLGSGPDPILATSDYAREQARLRLLTFFALYDESKLAWQRGDHDIEFPWGTWLVVVRHAARRASDPLASDASPASPSVPLLTA